MTVTHLNVPTGHYVAQVRGFGCRRWVTIGRAAQLAVAADCMVHELAGDRQRGRVLFVDGSEYYEPRVVLVAHRC